MLNYHTHSEFSTLDGFGTPEAFAEQVVKMGQKALGLMEHGNMLSALSLQRACNKYNIKPIFGCEYYFVSDVQIKDRSEKRNHMGIIAKNNQGFKDMQMLCSVANIKNFYYRPRIDIDELLKIDLRNVIISTVCPGSFINNPNIDTITRKLLENNADIFVEIQPHENSIHESFNKSAYDYALKWDLDLVAGIDAHAPRQQDVYTQDVLMAVQMRKALSDPNIRLLPRSKDQNFHTYCLWDKQRFLKMNPGNIPYGEIENAAENTNWIADECNVKIENKKIILPMPTNLKELNKSDEDILWDLCLQGFKKKLNIDIQAAENDDSYFMGFPEEEKRYELYLDRLNEEFDLLASKGFCTYFLIFDDLLKWARSENIPVGPGRGSAAGSLVAFLLNITYLDPIQNNLIFARFLNEQRNDFPDIDMDFGQKDRQRVIKHIVETYGEDHTGFIVTLSRMKTKAAIRDISRAFGVPLKDVNDFAKSCFSYDEKDDLEEGLDSGYGRIFSAKYPHVIDFVKKARGTLRGTSVHASGIIVNKLNLMSGDQCTVLRDKGNSNKRICGAIMDDCEDMGLMKLDVLGLATLDVLHHCRKISNIAWEKIPLTDNRVFEAMSSGKTLGAFQIEAMASTKVVKKIKPKNFDEVIACVALVRPGPMDSGMTDLYIDRKNGAKWEVVHKYYEEITKDTYGVLVYQESVMECFVKLAGMPFSKADKIRKIIGKKRDEKAFEPYWIEFRDGCKKQNTLSEQQAKDFWEGLLKWASYGFNKCLTGDTILIRSSGNQYTKREISIDKMYEDWNSNKPVGLKYRSQGVTVLQMDDDGKIRPGKVKKIYKNGIKEVFQVILENGMKIKGTYNHKLLSQNGYKKIEDITPSDYLVVKENYEETKKESPFTANKIRGVGETYKAKGFLSGKQNLGFVDGREMFLKEAKKSVFKRSQGRCERCGQKKDLCKKHTYEYAHIKSLEFLNGDYSQYHSCKNLIYMCNSCHKKYDYLKGERISRYKKGIPSGLSKVISIVSVGFEMTYDVEMDSIGHNFIANGIVSHNSHSASYALITYWCMWYKINFPDVFYSACLSFASWDEKKKDISKNRMTMLEEATLQGFKVMTPKYGESEGHVWVCKDKTLYMPFDCINSIEKKADQYASVKKQKATIISIFDDEEVAMIQAKNKTDELLVEMMCHDLNKLPSIRNQKKHLPFSLPYQKNVEISNK